MGPYNQYNVELGAMLILHSYSPFRVSQQIETLNALKEIRKQFHVKNALVIGKRN